MNNINLNNVFFLPILALLFWKVDQTTIGVLWTEKWGLMCLFLGSLLIAKTRGIFTRAFLFYVLVLGIFGTFMIGYYKPDPNTLVALRNASGKHLLCFFGFLVFLLHGPSMKRAIEWAGWLVLIGIFFSKAPMYQVHLLDNPTTAATFVVLATRFNPWASVISIILTHSYTASIAFAVGTVWKYKNRIPLLYVLTSGVVTIFVTALFVKIPDNGRFARWAEITHWWWNLDWWHVIFGTGPGSLGVWIPWLSYQNRSGDVVNITMWAHNDWLQLMVEYGIFGLLMAILAFMECFKRAYQEERGMMLAFAAAMVTNFPTHWAIIALVGWELMRSITSRSRSPETERTCLR